MSLLLAPYRKPALQFSGGKDSLACLYLMRSELERITVYWMNTGDTPPETLKVIDQVRRWIPNFVEVQSDVAGWRNKYGMPSDITPAAGHTLGVAYGLSDTPISNRFDCCWFNLMQPMHNRMLIDGVDVVIRGTKRVDTGRVPAEGPTEFYDILLPLRDWTHEEVFAYLRSVDAPENPIYDYFGQISAPECMGCTAWWEDGKASYFKNRHPEKYGDYIGKLEQIRVVVQTHLNKLDAELEN